MKPAVSPSKLLFSLSSKFDCFVNWIKNGFTMKWTSLKIKIDKLYVKKENKVW